jgi:hypothetical protein
MKRIKYVEAPFRSDSYMKINLGFFGILLGFPKKAIIENGRKHVSSNDYKSFLSSLKTSTATRRRG